MHNHYLSRFKKCSTSFVSLIRLWGGGFMVMVYVETFARYGTSIFEVQSKVEESY